MGRITASQRPVMATGDVRNCAVSFAEQLYPGEKLAGTPIVAEEGTSDLLIGNVAVSTEELTINGVPVAAGEAVQFKVAGQLPANSPYKLKIVVATDSNPPQTLVRYVIFVVSDR